MLEYKGYQGTYEADRKRGQSPFLGSRGWGEHTQRLDQARHAA
jgi:hypothetical protein